MLLFDVTDCRAEIIQPKQTLGAWQLTHYPFAVCNASLYDMKTYVPVGTIIEHGVLVHNDGNGYGVGIVDNKLDFGKPWDRVWSDYLTGYNSPVQYKKYVAPSFTDSYVFNNKLSRIAIGKRSGRTYIVTDDNVTLKQFANNAIAYGLDTLVNLDGGGSRHLYYNRKTIYSSGRVPYNAITFYGDMPVKPKEDCPYAEPISNIRWGSVGSGAKWVQWQLNRNGANLVVDGLFFNASVTALKKYQSTHDLVADGICGALTRNSLAL